ncbi:hybrid sensor histidine kinase/response regulator [uncultured Nonlabens sp.]|uniref:ATP-binding response regulator n=1 Tax=uncultured Nonlabens sp. TaxID=859306 RepID=UPI00260C9F49|nr:hybrid sensor histidine kinase/response regulator [uncultured Nonlabens sp.]
MITDKSNNDSTVKKQFIEIDDQGLIKKSDQNSINFTEGTKIIDVHPFFESVITYFNHKSDHIKLDCINMFDHSYDIEVITNKDNTGVIILKDRTDFYDRIQKIAQKRNESLIFNEVLELKNKMLHEKEVFKNKFIQNFAHEVRSPLTLISAFSSLLLKGELNLDQTKLVEAVNEQSDKLKKLMDDIIELSQLKKGKPQIENTPFSFLELIESIQLNFSSKISISSNIFEVSVSKDVPEYLIGDKRRIEQIISNLIENALLYNCGNKIKLEILENNRRAGKSSLRFVVHHQGLVPEDLENRHLFKDIEKIEPEGLSFSIVRELVDLMGGSISIKKIGDNSTQQIINIRVAFPLHDVEIPVKEKLPAQQYNFTDKVKVLIADQNSTTQYTALKVLVSTGNFDTVVYKDPRELLEAVEKHEYDLILISSSISQMDAVELIGIIKEFANDKNKSIPIIALTVRTSKEDIAAYRKAGFKDVVKKPYKDDELLNTIYKRLNVKKFL